jgi:hypothetical protein
MIRYVRAKIDWLTGGQQGPEPNFENYARGASNLMAGRVTDGPYVRRHGM